MATVNISFRSEVFLNLSKFLKQHESDIAESNGDFGLLHEIYLDVFSDKPEESVEEDDFWDAESIADVVVDEVDESILIETNIYPLKSEAFSFLARVILAKVDDHIVNQQIDFPDNWEVNIQQDFPDETQLNILIPKS